MGAIGRNRIETELAWVHQRPNYVGVYDSLLRPETFGSAPGAEEEKNGA
jgi:hypothetical protein